MRRICYLAVCAVYLVAASTLVLCPAHAGTPDTKAAPERGIAVLASSIGSDFTPEGLAEFVQQGKFSPVVVDWAWITYHWDRTNFAAVNRFLQLMAAGKVPVAAMYRPRFLANPTVPTQVAQDGKRAVDHAEICYSDPSARKWGISWGEKILGKCPSFKEIIIYNPLNNCHCPKCTAARANGQYTAVMGFLSEARSAWRAKQPGVKLGVVYMPVPEFWKANLAVVDVAHPYLCIREDVEPAKEVANIQTIRSIVKEKMGSCLGKITWEEGAKVSIEKLKTVDGLARKGGISYFFWTFETLFKSSLYDPKAVAQALGIGQPGGSSYTSDDSKRTSAETLLERVQRAEHGAAQFAAIDALAKIVKESDAASRSAILSLVIATMNDKSRAVEERWPCCYVISGSEYEPGIPDLIQVLLHDESDVMRSVAAEALGELSKNADAYDALLQASRQETSPWVRDVLTRRLAQAAPAPTTSSAPAAAVTAAVTVTELALSGPPQPPPGPKRPVAKPLPWPFPGDFKAQNIFNNYQTALDEYIHCGLDFIHPAGTPVTAVGPGYVAAIWSNPPHTGDFFIVTPEKGSNRGWCYTHLDPQTFTFREGDFIQQGRLLGKLVKFSPDEKYSMDHLHLHYVSFTKDASGHIDPHSLLDPLYFFDWKDSEPPTFQPLRFVSEGAKADAAGVVTVSGKVDILAAITDSAYPGQKSLLGVPVVMLSISDGTHTMQKLVLDHRGDVGDEKQTKPLYLSREESRALTNPNSWFPFYQVLRVTKTDDDGKITPRDAPECWDTAALDGAGKPLWPDGQYSVNVYAWDIAGNRAVVGATVQVKN
ncbi:MAG TPA: peptidoglycan DD-metalloendopeptidase family protein [Armatimonadota bacterium]|nr:peptidoglycan DD-metalloendopeptidase family protein [Armatimonadota bacterium]